MNTLSAASNVLAPAFYLLQEQGYTVYFEKQLQCWVAEKHDTRLLADNTIELCGLAYLHEAKGHNWIVSDEAIDRYLELE